MQFSVDKSNVLRMES